MSEQQAKELRKALEDRDQLMADVAGTLRGLAFADDSRLQYLANRLLAAIAATGLDLLCTRPAGHLPPHEHNAWDNYSQPCKAAIAATEVDHVSEP